MLFPQESGCPNLNKTTTANPCKSFSCLRDWRWFRLVYGAFSLSCHFPGLSTLLHNHNALVGSRVADALSVDGIASVAGIAVEE